MRTNLFFGGLFLVTLCVNQTFAQKSVQLTINRYLKNYVKNFTDDAQPDENKNARRIVFGDLNSDGSADAAIFFVIEMSERNSWEYHLAVFRKQKGNYFFVTETQVGGRFVGEYTLKGIRNGKILGTKKCDENQSGCNDVYNKSVAENYVLAGDKLKFIK